MAEVIRGDVMIEEAESTKAAAASKVRFIRDVPATDDFFNTHTRLAEAIVTAVEDNSEIKVVGLLGRWGSGKSTVANKIVTLVQSRANSGFRVFTYDAWLHQSDPLRRSFLESLIGDLVDAGAIAKGKWTKKLEKLSAPVEDTRTIETPVLTHDARWIGLSLLAVPVGLGLVDLDTLKAAFGSEATTLGRWTLSVATLMVLAPMLTWAALYLKRRPWNEFFDPDKGIRGGTFWRMLDENGEASSALQIFVDGQTKHTTTQTFRSIEPTSLEFGRMFQEIMREAADGGDRLIILIDNLDRVAAEEALGMWATIRSFFLASHETEDVKHESFHPTVILPIDRHAVEELFAGDAGPGGGRDRARSFMDKTFDVTFEVTEPVNSDWREFLIEQMKGMFGDAYQPSWGFWTRRMFESQLAPQQPVTDPDDAKPPTIVTPREINKLLNRVGTLYLQWASAGIPVEVMALYVIRRAEIDRGLLTFLQSGEVEIAEVAPQWKQQLAALHYGVEPDKAAQVLLEEPIRTALIRRDEAGLKALAPIPGFGEIFEYATANLPEPRVQGDPFEVLTNAVLLLHSLSSDAQEWAVAAWRNLVTRYGEIGTSSSPDPSSIQIVKLLADHVAEDGRKAFIDLTTTMLSGLLSHPRPGTNDGTTLRTAAVDLIKMASDSALPAPLFDLDIDPQIFVIRLSASSTYTRLWPQMRTKHTAAILTQTLAEMLGAKTVQQHVPPAVRCFTITGGENIYAGDGEIDFQPVAEKANLVVRQPENYDGEVMPSVRTLAELCWDPHNEGEELLAALVDDGTLHARLNETVGKSDWPAVAELVAILLWRGKKFDPPTAFPWSQYPSRDPSHPQRILRALQQFFPSDLVSILWGSRNASYVQSSFVETIIGYAVQHDSLGNFDAKPILADLHSYQWAVPSRLRDKFLEQVHTRSNLLGAIEDAPLGPQIATAASYLRRRGGADAERADELIRNRVEQADKSAWSAAIISGAEPFTLGQGFAEAGNLQFNRRSGLVDALIDTIPEVIKSGAKEVRERWLALLRLVKPKPRKALLEALGSAAGDGTPDNALQILKSGGVQFLRSGGFTSRPDQSVKTIVIPLLAKKNGREWLRDNRDELSGWVQRADASARTQLVSVLNRMRRSSQEDKRYTADFLATKWGLKLDT